MRRMTGNLFVLVLGFVQGFAIGIDYQRQRWEQRDA
ncbi:hypothetical protein KAMIYU_81 [Mycobacterium phage Kamiyu]|uniref:Uncharacterized protein n=5 Tax=Pipefishvirus TaxID=1982899 RepID=A0A345MCR6_9CAUD|nr:hypothetical protein KAMIYU_81 [Mycobacterium phage Kamiyu]AXH68287.1 hypothetical protein SEA_TYDOLLA_77 [Mycobacterium phage Tydolla]QGH76017.1 hypothetical protein SEA_SYNERGYX_81 [Mycobacterium phage SynergyX]